MSVFEALLETSTDRSPAEVLQWLGSMHGWEAELDKSTPARHNVGTMKYLDRYRLLIDGGIFDCRIGYPGSAMNTMKSMGSPQTISFDFQIARAGFIGCLDEIYRIAFGFCMWDPVCNVRLSIDDNNRGVFLRCNGRYLINPGEFWSASLASFLIFPYEEPDENSHFQKLVKRDWGITGPG